VASLPMGTGGFLIVLGMVSYFVLGDSLSLMLGLALVIILCSSLVLIIYLTRYSLEKE
jgi:membrane protein implicated in regulation of membrane protease activity